MSEATGWEPAPYDELTEDDTRQLQVSERLLRVENALLIGALKRHRHEMTKNERSPVDVDRELWDVVNLVEHEANGEGRAVQGS